MSNITLNIVEPSSPTPTEPVIPNTGMSTSGIGGAEAAIIVTVGLVVILVIVGAFVYRRKKQGKSSSLFARFKHGKFTTTGLAVLALLVSIGTVAGLVKLTTSAIEGSGAESAEDSSALTVDISSTELTIELADKPVFAVLPVDITVEEATTLGYTLTAYTEDTNLVSTTDSSKVIPMVTVDAEDVEDIDEEASEEEAEPLGSSLVALSPNTYGLSFTDPESALDEVYTSLSTDSTAPTFITDKDYEATLENDTTTIYYGFYITPDTLYGTYTGSNISVDAIPNIATVTFDANGLYYNDSEESTENTVGYKPNIEQAPIEEVVGEYMTPAPLSPTTPDTTVHYTFLGWSEDKDATEATYTSEEDILANLTLTKNQSLTLYAVWHYNTVLGFNGTTSDGGEAIPEQTIAAGTTITLPQNTFTRTGSVFTGWNTAADGTGEAYADEADFTAPDTSADITLYAQWAYTTTTTFNANGGTGSMSPQTIVAGTPQNLTKNTFTRSNATFIGWNTQANGSGTSYSDEAEFIASTEQHEDITLYAQWAYTTISFNGNTSDAGTMNPITIAGGTTSNLPTNSFTKNNCIFTGWNTAAEGTGISYGNSSPYQANATAKEEFTLYAQWQCISQVNYYGNGATSGEMASSIILGGGTLTFLQNSYVRDDYVFNGWNTKADGTGTSYSDQGTFTAPMTPATTLNLYAQWLPTTTISFNGNDATSGSMSDQVIVAGTPQNLTPNAYAKDGYVFNGWNTVQTPTTENPGTVYADKAQYTASTTQPESFTLYAQWEVPLLYNYVAKMSKGTQDAAALQATITAPTTNDPATDQSNSGVYEYNSSVFGEASDASNTSKIYYYRGILEQAKDQGSYGSSGKATTYPNYVRLGNNTCWRIVRTTGSGGVKMVYNGTWIGSTSTCANNTTRAQLTTYAFNSTQNNAVYVGYTYNGSMVGVTSSTSVDSVFGSNSNLALNNTRSNIKTYIEDTWYANNMTSYTDKLESSAGYCNDRSVYDTTGAALTEVTPQQSVQIDFGATRRNSVDDSGGPSLTCPRGNVDNYSYVANSNGTANELKYPAALITADEAALAGSGRYSGNPTTYNAKSYLRSGDVFWLLSPYFRSSDGYAIGFALNSNGSIYNIHIGNTRGVRPAISLKPGTTVVDGDGTATNPWTINE